MPYEQKDGQGALFKNSKKEKENQPDYQGDFTLNGKKYRIAAWLKQSKGGAKYMSLSVQSAEAKQEQRMTSRKPEPTGGKFDDMSDDIPF